MERRVKISFVLKGRKEWKVGIHPRNKLCPCIKEDCLDYQVYARIILLTSSLILLSSFLTIFIVASDNNSGGNSNASPT